MLDEILKSTKQSLIDRLSSPILGGFAISWCIWNYRFFVALFSQTTVIDTFSLLDHVIFPTTSSLILKGLVGPLATVLVYIFLYPYAAKFVFGYQRKRQKDLESLRNEIDSKTLLTLEESQQLRAITIERIRELEASINQKNADIEALRAQLASSNSMRNVQPKFQRPLPTPNTEPKVTDSQLALIAKIGNEGGEVRQYSLFENVEGKNKVQLEFDLEMLKSKNFIFETTKGGSIYYKLQNQGMELFLAGQGKT